MSGLLEDLARVRRELARRLGAKKAWLVRGVPEVPASQLAQGQSHVRRVCVLDDSAYVPDVRALGRACREPGEHEKAKGSLGFDPAQLNQFLVVDVSLISCYGMAPIRLGAHMATDDLRLVLGASASRRSGLHAVALAGDAERTRPGMTAVLEEEQAAADINEYEVEAISQGLSTLDARMRRLFDNAAVVASFLEAHPVVAELRYPGLPTDPAHELAVHQLQGGFGPFVHATTQGGASWVVLPSLDDPLETCLRLEQLLSREV